MFKLTRLALNRTIKKENGFYFVEDSKTAFPSVTTVLSVINKPFLTHWEKVKTLDYFKETLQSPFVTMEQVRNEKWLDNLTNDAVKQSTIFRDAAASFGTRAHDGLFEIFAFLSIIDRFSLVIERLCKENRIISHDEDLAPIVGGFGLWRRDNPSLRILHTELVVFSQLYGFAGTVDMVGRLDNKLVVFDWKTSNSIQSEYALQVAAYAAAFQESYNERVDEAWIIRFNKTKPQYEARRVLDHRSSFEAFLGCLSIWRILQQDLFTDPTINPPQTPPSTTSTDDQ